MFYKPTKLSLLCIFKRTTTSLIQTLLSLIIFNFIFKASFNTLDYILIPIFAGSISLVINLIVKPPEAHTDGSFDIDTNNAEKDIYRLTLDSFDDLSNKKMIRLIVNDKADLSQKKQLL